MSINSVFLTHAVSQLRLDFRVEKEAEKDKLKLEKEAARSEKEVSWSGRVTTLNSSSEVVHDVPASSSCCTVGLSVAAVPVSALG